MDLRTGIWYFAFCGSRQDLTPHQDNCGQLSTVGQLSHWGPDSGLPPSENTIPDTFRTEFSGDRLSLMELSSLQRGVSRKTWIRAEESGTIEYYLLAKCTATFGHSYIWKEITPNGSGDFLSSQKFSSYAQLWIIPLTWNEDSAVFKKCDCHPEGCFFSPSVFYLPVWL